VSAVDRHVIVLGADPIELPTRTNVIDPLLIAWCDQENILEWEPKSTNTRRFFAVIFWFSNYRGFTSQTRNFNLDRHGFVQPSVYWSSLYFWREPN
jgi:hypothetical protein